MMFFLALLNYLDRSTLSIANTEIASAFNLKPTDMGILLSAFMWPYAIASLPAGYLVDRLGSDKIMIISLLGWSLSCILGGVIVGFYSMLFVRLLLGIAEAPFFIIATKIIQQNFSVSKRGLISSIVSLGPRLANILAPLILVYLILAMSWRGMFILLGIVGLITTLVWLRLQNKFFSQQGKSNNINKTQQTSLKKSILNKNVIFLCIGNLCSSYAYWVFLTWLPFYFVKVKGLSLSQMGVATSAAFVSGIASVMLGGVLSDFLVKKGLSAVFSRLVPIVCGCIVAAISILSLPFIDNIFVIVCTIGVAVFCLGLRISPTWALVADISSANMVGTIGGAQNFANFIGAGLAPLVTGYILQATNDSFFSVFLFSGMICLLGSITYMFIRTRRVFV